MVRLVYVGRVRVGKVAGSYAGGLLDVGGRENREKN